MNTYELKAVSLAELFSLGGKGWTHPLGRGWSLPFFPSPPVGTDGRWAVGWMELCAAASFVRQGGTCLGRHPRKGESACLQSMPNDFHLHTGCFGHGWWVVVVCFQWKSTFASLVKPWCDISARVLVKNKALLSSEIAWFGGFIITIEIKLIEWFFLFVSLESPSRTGEIFPANAVIIQSWYISAVTFNLMNCHFSDEESLIWRLEFLLSRQIGNGGTENCVRRSTRSSTSEPRINWNGSGGTSSKFFQKLFCKYNIYFKLSSGQTVPLYFTKKNKFKKQVTRF